MKRFDVRIFQIHYRPEQIAKLDPAFIPFDNTGVKDPFLEFGVFKRLHASSATEGADLWGALSWKFGQKTLMPGADLLKQIDDHPGCDVYYCNHNPEIEALFQNLWMQGQTRHPGLLDLAQAIFRKARLDVELCLRVEPVTSFATANFFVATPRFWESYLAFIDRVLKPALSDPVLGPEILSNRADPRSLHMGASYLPFIVERLFDVFLSSPDGQSFKSMKYTIPSKEAQLSTHHHLLRQMKQAAWQTRSVWLLQCWYGYRNLYLELQNGTEWATAHIAAITPDKILFSSGDERQGHAR